jgi:hypothetical protein
VAGFNEMFEGELPLGLGGLLNPNYWIMPFGLSVTGYLIV